MLSPGAIPPASPSLQPFYGSMLGSVALGRAKGTGALAGWPSLSLED